ncbi:MAG: Argininosuccinate synthase [candidate division BRC1 bacterium ADurb.BinA292]|nr:MAG: Argininosuccinate synthase [candidate division BRC1 bacterium ADurb.BinA292]
MKIVLAYSGGLDTSVILKWLRETYEAEVIAFCADLGQEEELADVPEKARNTGASKCYVVDLVEEFATDFIYPMIQAGAIYEGQYFLGTSIARPLIAKAQVEIARREGADAVAHGATGKGNDQCRFELTYAALAPELKIISPWREWDFKGRTDLINYAKAHGIPVAATAAKPYSTDRNLLHISFEAGVLEDPWAEPPAECYVLGTPIEQAPDKPDIIELAFEAGNAVALKGPDDEAPKRLSPAAMLRALNKLGGRHGVGRVDMVENRFVGMKSRGVYETPGGAILHQAHRQIESLTLDRETMHLRDALIPRYAEMVYYGFWYAPEREALQALVTESQRHVTGTVRLKLYKGNIITLGRKSPVSLYQTQVASMEDDAGAYNQADAGGFIRLNSIRLRARTNQQTLPHVARQSEMKLG